MNFLNDIIFEDLRDETHSRVLFNARKITVVNNTKRKLNHYYQKFLKISMILKYHMYMRVHSKFVYSEI